jgi:hypothetical protein
VEPVPPAQAESASSIKAAMRRDGLAIMLPS